jgi:hypothetical protein
MYAAPSGAFSQSRGDQENKTATQFLFGIVAFIAASV